MSTETLIANMRGEYIKMAQPFAYTDDVKIDCRVVQDPRYQGLEFVWVLREMGTQLHPIGVMMDPSPIEVYAEQKSNLFYHLTPDGTVKPISPEKAVDLARKLPDMPQGGKGKVLQHLTWMLNTFPYHVFTKPRCKSIEEWLAWFEGNTSNTVAPTYIRECLRA